DPPADEHQEPADQLDERDRHADGPQSPRRQERLRVRVDEPLVRVRGRTHREDLPEAGHEEDEPEDAPREEDRPRTPLSLPQAHLLTLPEPPVDSARIAGGRKTTAKRYRKAQAGLGGPMEASETKSLPENAYRPLAPGETYRPVVPASASLPEATSRSIFWGLFLCAIFTAASAYSGLKVGQVMEAAIPISILAIGLARVYHRRPRLLENVIMTGVGGVSGSVVAGAIFTLPALYILKLDPHPWQTIFICLAGGCLGVLFLIPLRRYFVRDMHG